MGKKRWENRKIQTIREISDERSTYKDIEEDTFLIDGGEQMLCCSACGKDLVKIWSVKPNLAIKSFVRAECAYCGDHSFMVEIKGKFLTGHADGLAMTDNIMEKFEEEHGCIKQTLLIKTKIENE